MTPNSSIVIVSLSTIMPPIVPTLEILAIGIILVFIISESVNILSFKIVISDFKELDVKTILVSIFVMLLLTVTKMPSFVSILAFTSLSILAT